VGGVRLAGRFAGDFLSREDGVCVDADGVFNVAGVASSECGGHGDIATACSTENAFVTRF